MLNRYRRVLALVAGLGALGVAGAQERTVPETYTAVTRNMTPSGVELKADILSWSDDEGRALVVEALASEEPLEALRELPSLGVIWRSGSAVGHSIKYAHRSVAADGDESVLLVTDRRIGSTSFEAWEVENPVTETPLEYSVVEFSTGDGSGTLSLAAEIMFDIEDNTLSLDPGGRVSVLTDVAKAPPPYWAGDN